MVKQKTDYDINLVKNPDLDDDQVASEIGHCLRLKGYCVLRLGQGADALAAAIGEALEIKKGGHLQAPPEELVDALLGPDGTSEVCNLGDIEAGPVLSKLNSRMADIASRSMSFSRLQSFNNLTYLIQGGDPPDEVELTEEDCSAWISTLERAQLILAYFFGKGHGCLELAPADADADPVEFGTESDTLVIMKPEISIHKHVSTRGMFALMSWVLDSGPSTTRGWTGGLTKTLGTVNPATQELREWSQERMMELIDMETEEKLQPEIPREWQRMMHHCYFKKDRIPIAIRGAGAHMPSTTSSETWWYAINLGADFVTDVPATRWDHSQYYNEDPNCWMESRMYSYNGVTLTSVNHGQFIEGADLFDNKFFGLSVHEARAMDPKQRHIMETCYESLFNAGFKKSSMMKAFVAVFVGTTNPEFMYIPHDFGVGGDSQAIAANRVSFLLGLMGPSTSIDCEMSSAAMALALGGSAVSNNHAWRNKQGGNSTAAVSSGVYIALTPFLWPRWNALMNPAGRCFSFDHSGNGYVIGDCCASATLMPYAETVDGEVKIIEAPLMGTMVGWCNINSGRNASMIAPSGPAEQEAITESIRMAGISPLDLDAVECHAVGSVLADSVEATSAATVLRCHVEGGDREGLVLGSSRTNVGATNEASAMSSFLKVVYNLTFANHAPSLHLKRLNPYLEFEDAAVHINTEACSYLDSRAFHGVSSRGAGGTNVNIVCWGTADSYVSERSFKMNRVSFAYWPGCQRQGGADMLEDELASAKAYHLIGSWTNWQQPQEMTREKEGSYKAIVTLGETGCESFQILLDGDKDKVLHSNQPGAASGTPLLGPTSLLSIKQYHLNWVIDGRPAFEPAKMLRVPESAEPGGSTSWGRKVQPGFENHEIVLKEDPSQRDYVANARDKGEPGDKYEVRLMINGKYRAVTWTKMKESLFG
eukprot:TRINITY_DN30434_c0_g2_i1.p1 TRINITY_DN30434_c0_g2~~TRINITY_DN30434_c0_g2_i1.p1  ORF type:complete len:935 (-),score=146.47 TRINITY_DN30434_c0_g2_i1:166-2970(-)